MYVDVSADADLSDSGSSLPSYSPLPPLSHTPVLPPVAVSPFHSTDSYTYVESLYLVVVMGPD